MSTITHTEQSEVCGAGQRVTTPFKLPLGSSKTVSGAFLLLWCGVARVENLKQANINNTNN